MKFNVQLINLSTYYIYFINLVIVVVHSDVTDCRTGTLNVQLILYLTVCHIYISNVVVTVSYNGVIDCRRVKHHIFAVYS